MARNGVDAILPIAAPLRRRFSLRREPDMQTFKRSAALALAAVFAIAGCAGEDGKDGAPGTPGTNAPIVAGSGLTLEILSATAPATGQPTVTFKVTDAAGKPVDLAVDTFRPSWTIAQLNANGTYSSLFVGNKAAAPYVDGAGVTQSPVRTVTQAMSGAATAPVARANAGEYTVTLNAGTGVTYTAPTQTATVMVTGYGARTFEGTAYPGADSFSFVPAGGTPAVRQVVTDDACNACHKNLTAHGRRRSVDVCITCHTPQTFDPETNNTVDMRVMIHKLHSGQAGYAIVGYQQHFYDFSKVVFPDMANGVKNCALCHGGAAQAVVPSIAACQSCHTTLSDTHGGTTTCTSCHDGSVAPSVASAHSPLRDAATNVTLLGKTLDITIVSVDANVTAPTVTFTVAMDGVAKTTLARSDFCMLPTGVTVGATVSCGTFRFSVGGPTSDFGSGVLNSAGSGYGYLQSPSFTSNDTNFALITAGTVAGQFVAPLVATADVAKFAAAAGQSIAVGVEAYVFEAAASATAPGCGTGVLTAAPAASATCAVREWAQSPTAIKAAVVGGGTAVARRVITQNAKCNACHDDLGFHGGESRKTPEYCAFCHHPNNVNDERSTRLEFTESAPGVPTTTPFSSTPNSVSIMNMVHKLHAGSALSSLYVLGADRSLSAAAPYADTVSFPGAFPGDLGDCQTCHAAGSYALPKATNLGTLQVTYTCEERAADADNFCNTLVLWPATTSAATTDVYLVTAQKVVPPQTAACTSCHDSAAAVAHAELNTTAGGVESCAVCHGAGATYDALQVHQPRP
jgi:OmcA/MtrC family decaheme c-type cytochrome